jgi:hypothetical protein
LIYFTEKIIANFENPSEAMAEWGKQDAKLQFAYFPG